MTRPTLRILITGSRDWTDEQTVRARIIDAVQVWLELHPELGRAETDWVTLVHGACPTGADAHAQLLAEVCAWPVEQYPADWSRGRGAGPERNALMVSTRPDVCLAFIGTCTSPRCRRITGGLHASHGATGCAQLAEDAGIPTMRYFAEGIAS